VLDVSVVPWLRPVLLPRLQVRIFLLNLLRRPAAFLLVGQRVSIVIRVIPVGHQPGDHYAGRSDQDSDRCGNYPDCHDKHLPPSVTPVRAGTKPKVEVGPGEKAPVRYCGAMAWRLVLRALWVNVRWITAGISVLIIAGMVFLVRGGSAELPSSHTPGWAISGKP
jgi:hypothetical protein